MTTAEERLTVCTNLLGDFTGVVAFLEGPEREAKLKELALTTMRLMLDWGKEDGLGMPATEAVYEAFKEVLEAGK